ncbi:coenzyme A pyrophosphatase [Gemmatimonadetes bacterium T265]|nr:coenzyme A pyrophosphatase [Gemmatimonadetes bacterium T265]
MTASRPTAGRRSDETLDRLAAALADRPGAVVTLATDEPEPRRAAVALVLRPANGAPANGAPANGAPAPSLLLVKRAEYPGDPWSGHIAFPGGRAEPDDATPWDTAARETWEETGLDLRHNARLLGTLDELHPRTPTLPPIIVRPHVVVADAFGPLRLSDELADGFWVPLDHFAAPGVDRPSTVTARGRTLVVPSFVVDGHMIWGMTERILRQLLMLIA